MKKIILLLLALLPLVADAQFSGTGFYRAQNEDSQRYLVIVDNRSVGRIGTSGVDLGLLQCWKGFDERIVSNPASICFIEQTKESGSKIKTYTCNLSSQGKSLMSTDGSSGLSLKLVTTSHGTDIYELQGAQGSYSTGICDGNDDSDDINKQIQLQIDGFKRFYWRIKPVNQDDGYYFGITGEVAAADGGVWSSMKAAFAFEPVSNDTKVYTISKVRNGYAALKELTGRVPAGTPILFRCSSALPANNKLVLYRDGGTAVSESLLDGVYFCNDVKDPVNNPNNVHHRNVTYYDENTMRVLGVDENNNPAFVKGDATNLVVGTKKGGEEGKLFLPANKAYLKVPAGSPDVIKIVTEEEFATLGINDILMDKQDDGRYYDLQGRRVDNPTHGLYIVNGRKVVVGSK